MEKIVKRLLVVCVLVSIVLLAGCKEQEPAEPVVVEKAVEADVSEAAEKVKTDADKNAKEAEALMAKVQEMIKSASEQTKCPVMGGDIDKSVFTTYKDKKVYFCCAACIRPFEADSEKYVSKLPQFQQ